MIANVLRRLIRKIRCYLFEKYIPRERRIRTLQKNNGDAMKKHLMDQKPNNQGSELNSNDIKVGIECGSHRGWIQKENVGSVVRSSRSIFGALFLQEEHLKAQDLSSICLPNRIEFSSHDSS